MNISTNRSLQIHRALGSQNVRCLLQAWAEILDESEVNYYQ